MRRAYTILGYSGSGYGWAPILNCYQSLRTFEPDTLVILVNNYNDPIHPLLENEKNLRYFANQENFWELGAIQTAYAKNPDVDVFFMVHDTVTFIGKPPQFEDDIMFWENEFRNIAPELDTIKLWCEQYFPQYTNQYNLASHRVCHGLMACLTKSTLDAIMDIGLKHIRVRNKAEAVASEGILGFLLRIYKPSIRFYNEAGACPNLGYKNDPAKFQFMVKKALGRISGVGNSVYSNQPTFIAKMGSVAHPETPFSFQAEGVLYSSLAEAIARNHESKYHSIFMNYYIANRAALLELTEKRYGYFDIENNPQNINSLLQRFTHDLYILKHWGYFFHAEYDQVK